MLLPLWLAAIARLADGVCFVKRVETVARSILLPVKTQTLAACLVQGLADAKSESAVYNSASGVCTLLGPKAPGGIGCAPGTMRYVKMLTGCTKYPITEGYDSDPCLTNAKMNPELMTTDSGQICPNMPLNGEPRARTYVVAVILPSGKYAVFDNNVQSQIVWDDKNATNASWVYRYTSGRNTYTEPIFAASCAYYPDGVANDCPCNTPLAMETLTSSEQGATAVVQSINGACATDYLGRFVQAKSNAIITCGPCKHSSVVCIAGMWIFNATDPASSVPEKMNSYQLSNGTCYTTSACPNCS